ncbi:putative immunity protein [Vallicoccus soli]|uniref:Exonuclease SbcC n=1 Tax=Vallicoccus soli TaxID=2339232 RepID=A0A3A3YTI6_9ACTN|nr:exonuclease SbcC [Vallicoccus soli]RJK94755.1 exonuclease SbcC [Vallicoccus soli]
MPPPADRIDLSTAELRDIARFSADRARTALAAYEGQHPDDSRPRGAVDAADAFAAGGPRSARQRATAWAAHRAARDATTPAARDAARAAAHAAASAYLHPLADAHQVKHVLGAAAHAAHALELLAGGDREVGEREVEQAGRHAPPGLRAVLRRLPPAPAGGGRAGELMRRLDLELRR